MGSGVLRQVAGAEARRILKKYMPALLVKPDIYELVGPPSSVYYRIYDNGGEYALFLLYEWPYQAVPPHRYDYEPVVLIIDKSTGKVKDIYTDVFHYYVKRFRAPPLYDKRICLEIIAPWRSMAPVFSEKMSRGDIMVYPVDEKTHRIGARPVYLSSDAIRRLRSRRENPLSVSRIIIADPFLVRKAKHWSFFREPTIMDIIRDLAKNYGITSFTVPLRVHLRSLVDRIASFLESLKRRVVGRVEEVSA